MRTPFPDSWFGQPAPLRRAGAVSIDRWLWIAVLVAVVADLGTTVYGLRMGLAEGNPFVAWVYADRGIPGLVALKAVVLAWAGAVWRICTRRYGLAALAGLLLPQAVAVVSNLLLILSS